MQRRTLIAGSALALGAAGVTAAAAQPDPGTSRAKAADPIGSAVNTPMKDRTGCQATVYFTRHLSAAGLIAAFDRVKAPLHGKVAVKLHTGEKNGPNIIPRPWVRALIPKIAGTPTIVETNTYYAGDRYTTAGHRETLKVNGWTFCPVDITDEFGVATLPVKGGKYFTEMHVGASLLNYDTLLVLTHFKGHTMGGFGGANKNIGIGCADGRIGKGEIHAGSTGRQWGIDKDEFMERMTESTKSVIDHFAGKVVYVSVLRNMSVDCDCAGTSAASPTVPDIGILASDDILAIDQAAVDLVYDLGEKSRDLRERIESRHGLRQLSYMRELGMGTDRYRLVEI